MSWMDSWSRPSKHSSTPPPFYLLSGGGDTPYCHACGRLIGARRVQTSKSGKEKVKYCSERCRHQKPGDTDRTIEDTFVSLLNGENPKIVSSVGDLNAASSMKTIKASVPVKKVKGETRITVICSTVEELVFGSRYDPEKVFGRKRNRAKRGVPDSGEWKSVDMEDSPAQGYEDLSENPSDSEMKDKEITLQDSNNFPVITRAEEGLSDGSEANPHAGSNKRCRSTAVEDEELKQKREQGQKKAEEREAVRSAARRLCAFGVCVPEEAAQGDKGSGDSRSKQRNKERAKVAESTINNTAEPTENRRKCEAVMKDGMVVEPSLAKGEWGIRWRE